mgnify:FL=1
MAIQKVRSIFAYAKDYKNIIDQFRKTVPGQKGIA